MNLPGRGGCVVGTMDLKEAQELVHTPLTTAQRLMQIDELVEQLFQANTMFTPLYPWIFVMVCRKAQKVGLIYTPDVQNKVVHEGIVLAIWRDKYLEKTTTKDGIKHTHFETLRSELQLGNRVVFQHFAGKPVPGFDTDRFRVVKERDWHATNEGGIFARIEFADDHTKPLTELRAIFEAHAVDGMSDVQWGRER